MKIYGIPLSVHTRKVIAAATLKALPFELDIVIPVMPGNPPANWREISPTGLIPAIEDDGFILADSTAIIHYLERKHPTPALLPEEARALGLALFLDAWAGFALFHAVVHPIFTNRITNPHIRKRPADQSAIDAALERAAPEAFTYLESLGPQDFLVGGTLSLADLAVVSNLIMFHYLGCRIDKRFPRLDAYFRRQIASPIFRGIIEAERPFAEQMGLDRSIVAS